MDGRIRFEKAIESGPLVRRAHIVHSAGIGRAEHFAGVQDRKLRALINKLSQARILRSDEPDELFAKAVTYLRTPNFDHPAFSDNAETLGGESEQLAEGAAREFMKWDEEQRMAHLGNIESEVAQSAIP